MSDVKACCANCTYLWEMEDWTDYPHGRYFRKVCALFAKDKRTMALYGDLTADYSFCEGYTEKAHWKAVKIERSLGIFNGWKCSQCGHETIGHAQNNFCPNCGVKMEKD